MRINLSFPDMTLVKLVNTSSDELIGIKPNDYKFVWFSYKFVKEFSIDIADAINEGKISTYDYDNNIIPFYQSAYEISKLCRDVKKYPNGYLWNKDIGTILLCNIRKYIDGFNLSIDKSKSITDTLHNIFECLNYGMFKECVSECGKYIPNDIITTKYIDELIIKLETADAI